MPEIGNEIFQISRGTAFNLFDALEARIGSSTARYQVRINGTGGNDTINAHDYDQVRQTHIYAGGGDDLINMIFFASSSFSREDIVGNINGFNNQFGLVDGHHVRGDGNGSINRGDDVFAFSNVSDVTGIVQGRIEDFDPTRDQIVIAAGTLDEGSYTLTQADLAAGSGTIGSITWKIVMSNGDHNDPGSEPQFWILIENANGGQIFYALEGARVDMNGDGGANRGEQEAHFLRNVYGFNSDRSTYLDLDALEAVSYVDPINFIPEAFINSADPDGLTLNDYDRNVDDMILINGTSVRDVIAAGLNDDTVHGNGGDDMIWGGSGHDVIDGGDGNDSLHGGTGNDAISGGSGNDTLEGSNGNDTLNGGSADELSNADGADHFIGGEGEDWVSYEGSFGSLLVDLQYAHLNTNTAAGDTYTDIENIIGSQGADNLRGDTGDNHIIGGGNVDYLYGRQGNDTLDGGVGNDVLFGGAGADVLIGGDGIDRAQYSGNGSASVRADLAYSYTNTGSAAGDTYDSIEDLAGSEQADELYGNNGGNGLYGREGNDSLYGRSGDDYLNGGAHADRLDGGFGDDTLRGGTHNDTFVFNGGDDVIEDFTFSHADRIAIDDNFVTTVAGLTGAQIVSLYGSVVNGQVVLDFGAEGSITIESLSDLTGLAEDIFVF